MIKIDQRYDLNRMPKLALSLTNYHYANNFNMYSQSQIGANFLFIFRNHI